MQTSSMHSGQSTQSLRVESLLRPIFVSLPMPRGIDADALLAGYFVALESQPLEALQSVVIKLVKGTWSEEVKFCPRPPELANMVREEARRQREASMPRIAYMPAERPPIVAMMEKKYAHRKVLASNIDTFNPEEWPAGTCFVPILGKVFAPDEAEKEKAESPTYRSLQKSRASEPAQSYHDPEYWEKINALRDAPSISEEQMAFRRKIGKEIEATPNEATRKEDAA